MSAPPLPEAFGNYALKDFVEITAPAAIDWWPQTAGWLWLGAGLLAWLAYRGWQALRRWYRDRYRREAIARLQALAAAPPGQSLVGELNRLLKLTALAAFPREQVARLSGEEWVQFLNRQCPGAPFSARHCELLARAAYDTAVEPGPQDSSQLLAATMVWLRQHERAEDV